MIVATVVAFVVGYAAIAWLLRYLAHHSVRLFVVYRVAARRVRFSSWWPPGRSANVARPWRSSSRRSTTRLRAFIEAQPMFFVATAPLDADGTINLSPKGLPRTFAVLGPNEVAYLDITGSGIETIAHLRENGRIVVMFCAFEGDPNIVRLHGRGS